MGFNDWLCLIKTPRSVILFPARYVIMLKYAQINVPAMPKHIIGVCRRCSNIFIPGKKKTSKRRCSNCGATEKEMTMMPIGTFADWLRENLTREIKADIERQYRLIPKGKQAAANKSKERRTGGKSPQNFDALESVYGAIRRRVISANKRGEKFRYHQLRDTVNSPAHKEAVKAAKVSIPEAVKYIKTRLQSEGLLN
jgi:hypothetical protein